MWLFRGGEGDLMMILDFGFLLLFWFRCLCWGAPFVSWLLSTLSWKAPFRVYRTYWLRLLTRRKSRTLDSGSGPGPGPRSPSILSSSVCFQGVSFNFHYSYCSSTNLNTTLQKQMREKRHGGNYNLSLRFLVFAGKRWSWEKIKVTELLNWLS